MVLIDYGRRKKEGLAAAPTTMLEAAVEDLHDIARTSKRHAATVDSRIGSQSHPVIHGRILELYEARNCVSLLIIYKPF